MKIIELTDLKCSPDLNTSTPECTGFINDLISTKTELLFCNYHPKNMPLLLRWLNGFNKDTLITKSAYEQMPKFFQKYLEPHNPKIKYIPMVR